MSIRVKRQPLLQRHGEGADIPRPLSQPFVGAFRDARSIADAHTWLTGDQPLLFDVQYQPKPAFYGVLDALRGR